MARAAGGAVTVPPLPAGVPALPTGTRYGEKLAAGIGYSTILAEMDFETFSPAGFVWDESVGKFRSPRGATKKGLSAVGAANYTLHPDAEVLHLAYDLKDGKGGRRWKPGESLNYLTDLFQHLAEGKLMEAHNVGFDAQVWENICVPKYGFPPLLHAQLRCSMAKARAHALPGKLSEIGDVLNLDLKKDKEGERLIKMFTHPRDPTAKDPRTRIMPEDEPEEFEKFRKYGDTDIGSEAEASSKIPDLGPTELAYWQMDQRINRRGMQVDMASVDACLAILDQVYPKYNLRLSTITGGQVSEASKVEALKKWLRERGVSVGKKLGEEEALEILKGLPEGSAEHEALTIRLMIGSAAVKKIYALKRRTTAAQRLHDMYTYYGARTGRATGAGEDGPGVQGQNLPNSGPLVYRCEDMTCRKFFGRHHEACPWCASTFYVKKDWCPEAVEDALSVVHTRSLVAVEYFFGNAVKVISGSLRGLLVAGPGKRLICSDFSSIEGVVTAFVAGEEWMMEVYRTHGKIYEATASQITGIPFEEFMRVAGYTDLSKPNWWLEPMTGAHHPMRKKIGKPGALGSGFGGWVGAWKRFGADEFLTDEEIKDGLKKWRAKSPNIVEMWGGQFRGLPWDRDRRPELYGLEGMIVSAILHPGREFSYRMITYFVRNDVLYCRLPSGRTLDYHQPRLSPSTRDEGAYRITFWGHNSNPTKGPLGWICMELYGGIAFQNVVQAIARDIMFNGMLNLEERGYPIVLHTHDEPCAEVPEGWGSIEEFEAHLTDTRRLPWCTGWPIKAAGGWAGFRYRKD